MIGFLATAITSPAGAERTVEGSGVQVTEKRDVAPFETLDLNGAFTASVTCGKVRSLEISGDDNIIPLIRTEVRDGRLYVYSSKSFTTKNSLKISVAVPDLHGVAVSGANTVSIANVENDSLKIETDGVSTATVAGKTKMLEARLSGGAALRADGLRADLVRIEVSGTGDADVYATAKLDVSINGVGSIRYRGNPVISRQITGVGDISAK